jgi:hypothetical protein
VAAPKTNGQRRIHTGWSALLSKLTGVAVLFLAITGLAVTFGSFQPLMQWGLLAHTAIGLACVGPLIWYTVRHWRDYAPYQFSAVVLLGYLAGIGLIVCVVSGVVVTAQGLFAARMSWAWRETHLVSTYVTLGAALPHVVWLLTRVFRLLPESRRYVWQTSIAGVLLAMAIAPLPFVYSGPKYVNKFPDDYSYAFGKDRPFAPSLAKTSTNGAFDSRMLAGSNTCGTARCHTEIVKEWTPSAHRYSAMDPLFQLIQTTMAKQNGAESTRYCGGCHDPISLFSGTKNIFVKDLTGHEGYQEGVSCLTCHSIKETDIKGNAAYTMSQPTEYLWQWQSTGAARVARDFLIRTYPDEHNKLSKRLFKAPQYCAACHKQFIDQEVNRVGWVQLQNQYDNWANSHWNKKGDPRKTVECRECHMPLVDSRDPAAGDTADYNRTANDGKHRSHRFVAANSLVPAMLKLDGWERHVQMTEEWLHGKKRIPEIEDKWGKGSIVGVSLAVGTPRNAGAIPVRVVLTSNKVGHDYPTGPLDIIQSWLEIHVVDDQGREVFTSGTRDAQNFIKPGSFLFKAEPVDQHGNLIDRHNLWEMVGVRFRRALFPGYSDTVEYEVDCAGVTAPGAPGAAPGDRTRNLEIPQPARAGKYTVTAILEYRKVDQFLINFLLGEKSGITAPVVEIGRASAVFEVAPGPDKKPVVTITGANN